MQGNKTTRRRVIATAGTGTLVALAGVFYGSQRTQALDVGVTQLAIDDQTVSTPDAPSELLLEISGDYKVNANVVPDELRLIPRAEVDGSVMGYHEFAKESIALDSKDATDTFALEVNLLALSSLRDIFPESEGETASRTINVELLAAVYKDSSQIGTAEVRKSFELTLKHETANAKIAIDASGVIQNG